MSTQISILIYISDIFANTSAKIITLYKKNVKELPCCIVLYNRMEYIIKRVMISCKLFTNKYFIEVIDIIEHVSTNYLYVIC